MDRMHDRAQEVTGTSACETSSPVQTDYQLVASAVGGSQSQPQGDVFKRMPLAQRAYSKQFSVDQAMEILLGAVGPLAEEELELHESYGRILSRPLISDIDVSPFDNSAMDGFALRAQDLIGVSSDMPADLKVCAHIGAGSFYEGCIEPGFCARIMTGAPIPQGADCVVKIEETSASKGGGEPGEQVSFYYAPQAGEHVRKRGEEIAAGQVILEAGEQLNPAAVGLAACAGHSRLWVYRKPRVGVLATGSELVDIADKPRAGQIRNSNSYMIAALASEAGAQTHIYPVLPDDYEQTKEALKTAASECDLLLTSGGVSVGDFDYIIPALSELGEVYFTQVLMRPGSHQTFGRIGNCLLYGLPGNPSSAFTGFQVFVRSLIRKLLGHQQLHYVRLRASLLHDVKKRPGTILYQRSALYSDKNGALFAEVLKGQSSALLRAAHQGNAFMILPEEERLIKAGEMVDCILYKPGEGFYPLKSADTDR